MFLVFYLLWWLHLLLSAWTFISRFNVTQILNTLIERTWINIEQKNYQSFWNRVDMFTHIKYVFLCNLVTKLVRKTRFVGFFSLKLGLLTWLDLLFSLSSNYSKIWQNISIFLNGVLNCMIHFHIWFSKFYIYFINRSYLNSEFCVFD